MARTIPESAARRLNRKVQLAKRRVAGLEADLEAARKALTALEEAERSVTIPGAQRINLRAILGEVRLTQRDMVLEALRQGRPKRGMSRAEVVQRIKEKHGVAISLQAATTYLSSLRAEGLADYDGDVWRPAPI